MYNDVIKIPELSRDTLLDFHKKISELANEAKSMDIELVALLLNSAALNLEELVGSQHPCDDSKMH